jgi:hypothetical protein
MIPFVDKESIQYKEYAVKKDEYNTREEERKIVEQAAKARLAVLEGMKKTYSSQRTQLNKMLPENLKFEEPAVAPILETTPSTPASSKPNEKTGNITPAPQKIRSIEDFTKETNANKNLTKEQKQDQIDRYTRGFNNIKTEEKVTAPPPPGGAIPDAKK